MPWYEPDPRPRRQYVFRSRRCRQRIAQALGAGMGPERVAAAERLPPEEVRALLGDDGFRRLVEHYRDLAELAPDARLRRLVALAGEMLELLVASGDLRAVVFVLHETRRGRDPRRRLAEGALRSAAPPADRPAPRPAARPRPGPPVEWPAPLVVTPRDAGHEPFAFCAATQLDGDAAAMLAAAEAAKVERRLAGIGTSLRARLVAEAERRGTAGTFDSAAAARAEAGELGRSLHEEGESALRAAAEIQERRDGFARGEPPWIPSLAPPEARPPCSTSTPPDDPPGGTGEHAASADPPSLPAWLDQVDARVRLMAVALPPHEAGPYLARIGRFYGFDTS